MTLNKKRKSPERVLFALVQLVLITSISDAKEIHVRVAEWPPLYYQDKSGDWSGLEVELAGKIIQTAGFEPKYISVPWKRSLLMMKNGDLQMMLNLSKKKERSEYMYWLGPVRYDKFVLVVKNGNERLPIKTLDDFITVYQKNKIKFGYTSGVNYGDVFNHRLATDEKFAESFETIHDPKLNMKKVVHSRNLGFFEAKTDIVYQIKTMPEYQNLAIHPFILHRNENDEACYVGISKKGVDPETYRKLDEAYHKLRKNNSLKPILDKYLN